MADVAETGTFTEPGIAISQGRRHLLVRDYTMAVSALAQACQLLAEKHGDTADQLGEPYLLYGRALLGLAREEAGVLGERVPPGSEEPDEDDEEDEDEDEEDEDEDEDEEEDEEEEEKLATVEEKDEAAEGKAGKGGEPESKRAPDQTGKKEESSSVSKKDRAGNAEAEPDRTAAGKSQQQSPEEKVRTSETEKNEKPEHNGRQTKPTEDEHPDETDRVRPGSSKEPSHTNESGVPGQNGGRVKEGGNDDSEDIEKDEEEEDEEVNNLQVAWEVLELAKLVLTKRGKTGWKLLADAHRLLGEVAMEGGNHVGALNDLHGCLDLLQKVEPRDARAIAEIHYQLALAHSLGNDFDQSIAEFNKATALLESRIRELEETKDPPKAEDTFYTVEGEIQELKELLPEIQEKITDMKDFKQEACRLVIEGIKSKVAGGCSNGAGPSTAADTSAPSKLQKPTSDISHLVRKKRKAEDTETTDAVGSPCKKPTPEKAV